MYQRILVPVDGSATAAASLEQAILLAQLTGATLCIVHVLDAASYCNGFETGAVYRSEVVPRMKQTGALILDASRRRVERAGLTVETALFESLSGGIADLVPEHAKRWGADLIVVGTHGRRGADRFFMGSDAEQVLRGATVAVLLVRSARQHETRSGASTPVSASASPCAGSEALASSASAGSGAP